MNENRQSKGKLSKILHTGNYGKIPPQVIDLEEAVLGAVMLEKDCLPRVNMILIGDCFYKDSHRLIYEACCNLFIQNQPVDILTVTSYLRDKGQLDLVGGPFAITQLTNRVASSANVEYHATIIFEKYVQREIIRSGSVMVRDAFEESSDSLIVLDNSQKILDGLFQMIGRSATKTWATMVRETHAQIFKARQSDNHLFGLSTGFKEVDRLTSGRIAGDLVIIAARPGMGKTTRMLQEIINVLTQGLPVGCFSLEMPFQQLVIKMLANQTDINSNVIRSGRFDDRMEFDVNKATESLMKMPLYLNDISGIHINEIKAIARAWKQKYDIRALYVDYLQLIHGGGDKWINRDQEIGNISRGLKAAAKDLGIPVIALSQLSRAADTRSGEKKKPQLSDLRESGNIEQDADVVEFLYREDYYDHDARDQEGKSLVGLVENIVAKNRNGPLDTGVLFFKKETSMLRDHVENENYSNRSIVDSRFEPRDEDPEF